MAEVEDRLDRAWARVADGDRDAFSEVLAHSHRALRMFITARLPNPDLVEEVLQQTYVTAFEERHRSIAPGKVLAFLRGIARNMTARCWRELQRGERQVDALEQFLLGSEPAPDLAAEAQELAGEISQALTACLGRLPERSRKILLAAYHEELSQKRLAQRFSLRVAAIKRLLFKTRGQLRDCLQTHGVAAQ